MDGVTTAEMACARMGAMLAGVHGGIDAPLDDLGGFIPAVTAGWVRPDHLLPMVKKLEECDRRPVRAIFSIPPRLGKTETLLHDIARSVKRRPDHTMGYVSYAATQAWSKAVIAQDYMLRVGVQPSARQATKQEWRTTAKGGLFATGFMGPFTGQGVHKLIIDDPISNPKQAYSPAFRDAQWEWFNMVAENRLEPGGSIIICMHRWHPDDLSGRLIKEQGLAHEGGVWEVVRIPALADGLTATGKATGLPCSLVDPLNRELGEAIWPERFDAAHYESIQERKPRTFRAMFQGLPASDAERLFHDVHFYERAKERDPLPNRRGAGLDMAYTEKKRSDHTCFVMSSAHTASGQTYVEFADRWKKAFGFTKARVKTLAKRLRVRVRTEANGPQRGNADSLADDGVPVQRYYPTTDKWARWQDYAEAWNAGEVRLPGVYDEELGLVVADDSVEWLEWYIEQHMEFTGMDGEEDDAVDAGGMSWEEANSTMKTGLVGSFG